MVVFIYLIITGRLLTETLAPNEDIVCICIAMLLRIEYRLNVCYGAWETVHLLNPMKGPNKIESFTNLFWFACFRGIDFYQNLNESTLKL